MILSRTLYQVLASEIGRYCAGSFGNCEFLGSSTIVAWPICAGTSLVSHMCVISLCVILAAVFPPAWRTSAQMLSGPGALFFARFCIVYLTSFNVGGGVGSFGLCSKFGGLYSVYRFLQKSVNSSISVLDSFTDGFSPLLCWSLTFLIIFQQSGVLAMICSIWRRSLPFL